MNSSQIRDNSLSIRLNRAANLLSDGQLSKVWEAAQKKLYSEDTWFGMRRNLGEVFQQPKAKIDISVRLIEERDLSYLLSTDGMTAEEAKIVGWRHKLLDANFQYCYVAVTADDTPCYMQWLIGPAENENILKFFRGLFPELKAHEALLEGAYMHPSFRGLGVMPDAMCQISEKAKDIGASETITFVQTDNAASLRGCKSCGYYPYALLKSKWFIYKQDICLEAIPDNTLAEYVAMITK
ncbi:GNAT family N-acetyltransferase [Pontibacter flavimaris]|uniref:N-acetyltransferase domain-containing protein n=1 Tax=Pontibacter flavimaris TaxID=1797110 RepID=A0A1Q5P9J4_9BACT|nr:GNAT family N-acetyltransferase [Pontibacter flavimaris]OKL38906.1 hypothetical protein A3841_02850 [Pontibacter flavimaris]